MKERTSRSIAKAVTWRVWGTIDTAVIAFIVTGDFEVAGSIASIELVVGTVGYFLHERLWSLVEWGRHALHLDAA